MALFDDTSRDAAERRPPLRRSSKVGFAALAVALVVLVVLSFLPTGYVIQRPGPVWNTLGTAPDSEGDEVPLIRIEGAATYETSGALDLTTVEVVGNRERPPSWLEVLGAWFDGARAVVPVESVFPEGQTSEQRSAASAQMMVDSQQEATAAALTALGYEVSSAVRVHSLPENSPAGAALTADDVIVAAAGTPVNHVDGLREIIQRGAGAPVILRIDRDGRQQEVEVTPEYSEEAGTWQLGVSIIHDYDFPLDVTIQLDDVGGPSAGLMFALGIIDTLTPDDLNGGERIAGTGTIGADGAVGRIGGIRQKLFGARDAGATAFLAPAGNCDEVVGHVPAGLRVFAVDTLAESLAVLESIRDGKDASSLPSCTSE